MSGASLTTMNDILKTQYIGPVREQLNNRIILLKRLGKDMDSVVGKNFTMPLHISRNEGVGARAEGETLPTPGAQGYKETIVPMAYHYGRIELTGQTIAAARKDEGAFLRAVDSEMKGLIRDLKSDKNRQIFGDSTGQLTVAGTTTASTTVTVADTSKLRVGMPVDIKVIATGLVGTGALNQTILTIPSSTTFTIGTAVTTDSTYAVYRQGTYNNEVMGLDGIVSDGDPISGGLQGLPVATYPWWKAQVLDNGGTPRAITELLLQESIDDVESKSDGETSCLFTTYGVRRAYQELLQTDRRYHNTMEFKGGFKALEYNGMPMFVDKDCQAGRIYGLDEDHLKFLSLQDWAWMEDDKGSILRVSVNNKDAYEATMYEYCNLAVSARNTQFVLKDITEA